MIRTRYPYVYPHFTHDYPHFTDRKAEFTALGFSATRQGAWIETSGHLLKPRLSLQCSLEWAPCSCGFPPLGSQRCGGWFCGLCNRETNPRLSPCLLSDFCPRGVSDWNGFGCTVGELLVPVKVSMDSRPPNKGLLYILHHFGDFFFSFFLFACGETEECSSFPAPQRY